MLLGFRFKKNLFTTLSNIASNKRNQGQLSMKYEATTKLRFIYVSRGFEVFQQKHSC